MRACLCVLALCLLSSWASAARVEPQEALAQPAAAAAARPKPSKSKSKFATVVTPDPEYKPLV